MTIFYEDENYDENFYKDFYEDFNEKEIYEDIGQKPHQALTLL